MDRLETSYITISTNIIIKIYIPVWIDQKRELELGCFIVSLIYIPVWIDQKHEKLTELMQQFEDLHSSMDRLETKNNYSNVVFLFLFTFQYGQIRNGLIRASKKETSYDLHSSMDRLET